MAKQVKIMKWGLRVMPFAINQIEVIGASAPSKIPSNTTFLGYLLEKFTSDLDPNRPILLVLDPLEADLRLVRKTKSFAIAILMEPPVVLPSNGKTDNFKSFDLVFELGKVPGSVAPNHRALPWPQEMWIDKDFYNKNRRRGYAMVCGNKFSFVAGELYSLRRKIIKDTALDIHLFGTGWQSPALDTLISVLKSFIYASVRGHMSLRGLIEFGLKTPKNFRGQPNDKLSLLTQYERSVVIENWVGYYSEKLFDALRAGTLPIYVGPQLDEIGVPKGFALQVPAEYGDIVNVLNDSALSFRRASRKNIESWLTSEENPHLYKNVARRILKDVAEVL